LFLFFYFLPKLVVLPLKALILIASFEEGTSVHEKLSSEEAILTGGLGKRIKVILYIILTLYLLK
jgi:hypothetical protein